MKIGRKSIKGDDGLISDPRTGDDYFANACAYEIGKGRVRKNPAEAFRSFQMAARQHHIEACFKVGEYLMQGRLRKADMKSAVSYFREAAEGGHLKAIERMMKCAGTGTGMPQNREVALRWAEKAKSMGSKKAVEFLESFPMKLAVEAAQKASDPSVETKRVRKQQRAAQLERDLVEADRVKLDQHLARAKMADEASHAQQKELEETAQNQSEGRHSLSELLRGYFHGDCAAATHLSEYMAFLTMNTQGGLSARYAELARGFSGDAEKFEE